MACSTMHRHPGKATARVTSSCAPELDADLANARAAMPCNAAGAGRLLPNTLIPTQNVDTPGCPAYRELALTVPRTGPGAPGPAAEVPAGKALAATRAWLLAPLLALSSPGSWLLALACSDAAGSGMTWRLSSHGPASAWHSVLAATNGARAWNATRRITPWQEPPSSVRRAAKQAIARWAAASMQATNSCQVSGRPLHIWRKTVNARMLPNSAIAPAYGFAAASCQERQSAHKMSPAPHAARAATWAAITAPTLRPGSSCRAPKAPAQRPARCQKTRRGRGPAPAGIAAHVRKQVLLPEGWKGAPR